MNRSACIWISGLLFLNSWSAHATEFNDVLAPGNAIRLTSYDEQLINGTFELDWSGTIDLPLCGKTFLRGLDLAQAHKSLTFCLGKYFKNSIKFEMSVLTPRQVLIKVGKRNEKLTLMKVPQQSSVNTILAAAGPIPGHESIVRLISPFGLDIVLPADSNEWAKPFAWRGGETVLFENPPTEKPLFFVDVLGEVKKPGKLDYKPGLSILSLIRDAQGLTTSADQDSIYIIRTTNGKRIESAWDDQKTKIEPGDVLFVPAQKETGFERGLRWTGSLLTVINTLFLILLARKG